jgi:hypothetical protein
MFRENGSKNDDEQRAEVIRYMVTSDFQSRFNALTIHQRSQSPQPYAQNGCDDQCDPAQAHRDGMGSERDLRLINDPRQVCDGDNGENHTGNAQSRSW